MAAALIFSAGAMTACQASRRHPLPIILELMRQRTRPESRRRSRGSGLLLCRRSGQPGRCILLQVIFTENGIEREYDIDAMTGVVIEEKILTPAAETAAEKTQETETSRTESQESPEALSQTGEQTPAAQAIDEEGALSAALAHAGVAMEDISRSRVEQTVTMDSWSLR